MSNNHSSKSAKLEVPLNIRGDLMGISFSDILSAMKKAEDRISLDFVSDLKYTEFSVMVLGYIKNFLKINEDDFFKIEIALREVINNAIRHGNQSNQGKRVRVKFRWRKKYLYINVKDENTQKVDFKKIIREVQNKDILSPSGRGITIMKNYMDRVEFLPSNHGTEIVMEKRI
jgi:anti-sigma regulatory factor (Ser/Thr protein kinase)